MNIFLAPHNDDEVLFATYTLLKYKPKVVVCLRGETQPLVTGWQRELESIEALKTLGYDGKTDFIQLPGGDARPDWGMMKAHFHALKAMGVIDLVFAPMIEDGGHDQHNMIGEIAREVFPNVQGYATYRRGFGRTRTQNEIKPEPGWCALKLRAMACYESQIEIENTRPWFFGYDADREWWE